MLDNPVVSPRLNVRYSPNDHIVLRTGYSSGFRAPQVYDEALHVFLRDFDSGDERDSSYIYGPSRPRTFFVGLKLNI